MTELELYMKLHKKYNSNERESMSKTIVEIKVKSAKAEKTFTIIGRFQGFSNRPPKEMTGTLEELKKSFKYTLECGKSYEHESGNYKVNTDPKSIKALVSALNKAEHNRGSAYQEWLYCLKNNK